MTARPLVSALAALALASCASTPATPEKKDVVATTSDAVKVAEPAPAVEVVKPAEPAPVVEAAKPAEPAPVVETVKAAEPAPVATPTAPAKAPEPVVEAKPAPATKPAEPAKPAEPKAVTKAAENGAEPAKPAAPKGGGKYTIVAVAPPDKKTERTWKAKCASCHGADGKAATEQGRKMKMYDMTLATWQTSRSDEDLRQAVKKGVKTTKDGVKQEMDAFEDLQGEQLEGLVKMMRWFGAPK